MILFNVKFIVKALVTAHARRQKFSKIKLSRSEFYLTVSVHIKPPLKELRFYDISETGINFQRNLIFITQTRKFQLHRNMFWFLRRTGAASFLSAFNNNKNTSKVANKSEKNIAGCDPN